ncbi:MAG: hypothetical protein A2W91_09825 [Bacteroidetes bacterium GWF2_38_335]|nr:MAG: hypothetical protein A2W91_09825 [Bacteroidetes bacterium GWF2_38_335]
MENFIIRKRNTVIEKSGLILFFLFATFQSFSQFTVRNLSGSCPVYESPNASWKDFNSDGYLDIVLHGCLNVGADCYGSGVMFVSEDVSFNMYFFDEVPGGMYYMDGIAWADFNNDEKMDLVISGYYGIFVYFQTDSGFVDTVIADMYCGDLDVGDYDLDGDADILSNGVYGFDQIPYTSIFLNNEGFFTESTVEIEPLNLGSCDWGDYDQDGDLDICYNGVVGDVEVAPGLISKTYILRNDGGVYNNIEAPLPGLSRGDIAWVDFDGDGDLDLSMKGLDYSCIYETEYIQSWTDIYFKMYENIDGSFVEIPVTIPGTTLGAIDWGDFDADGDPDLLISGEVDTVSGWQFLSRCAVYENIEGTLTLLDTVIGKVQIARWGDYEGDGDLDFLTYGGIPKVRLFLNDMITDFENKEILKEIIIYPNPAKDEIFVEIPDVHRKGRVSCELYDVNGRLIDSGYFDSTVRKIDIAGLNRGLYVIKIKSYSGLVIEKIVKI